METGASYYGIMELSGNLREMIVSLFSNAGVTYTGLHGDGELENRGFANTDYWPGIDSNWNVNSASGAYTTVGVVAGAGIAARGGYYSNYQYYLEVSDRQFAYGHTLYLIRSKDSGGRMVRTAP